YGVGLVHQQPQFDELGQAANFLPDKWVKGQAPVLYLAGCAAQPCTGNNRQAMDPRTGALLGPATSVAIGTLVPSSGNSTNGLFLSGQGISKTTYTWPMLAPAPRFGTAYDVTGHQNFVLRAGALLRSAGGQLDLRAGAESADRPQCHAALQHAAIADVRARDRSAAVAERVSVQERPAVHLAVERRRADPPAGRDRARRRVHRPARVQP